MALRRVAAIAVLLASTADALLLASRPALSFSRRAAALMSGDPLAAARAAVQEAEEAEAAALAELANMERGGRYHGTTGCLPLDFRAEDTFRIAVGSAARSSGGEACFDAVSVLTTPANIDADDDFFQTLR